MAFRLKGSAASHFNLLTFACIWLGPRCSGGVDEPGAQWGLRCGPGHCGQAFLMSTGCSRCLHCFLFLFFFLIITICKLITMATELLQWQVGTSRAAPPRDRGKRTDNDRAANTGWRPKAADLRGQSPSRDGGRSAKSAKVRPRLPGALALPVPVPGMCVCVSDGRVCVRGGGGGGSRMLRGRSGSSSLELANGRAAPPLEH